MTRSREEGNGQRRSFQKFWAGKDTKRCLGTEFSTVGSWPGRRKGARAVTSTPTCGQLPKTPPYPPLPRLLLPNQSWGSGGAGHRARCWPRKHSAHPGVDYILSPEHLEGAAASETLNQPPPPDQGPEEEPLELASRCHPQSISSQLEPPLGPLGSASCSWLAPSPSTQPPPNPGVLCSQPHTSGSPISPLLPSQPLRILCLWPPLSTSSDFNPLLNGSQTICLFYFILFYLFIYFCLFAFSRLLPRPGV